MTWWFMSHKLPFGVLLVWKRTGSLSALSDPTWLNWDDDDEDDDEPNKEAQSFDLTVLPCKIGADTNKANNTFHLCD